MRLTASGSVAACSPPSTARCLDHQLMSCSCSAPEHKLRAAAPLQEIYPGTKTRHFRAVHKASDIAYRDMLFFDNEHRNVRDCAALGITSVYTPDGTSPALGPAHPALCLKSRTMPCLRSYACVICCNTHISRRRTAVRDIESSSASCQGQAVQVLSRCSARCMGGQECLAAREPRLSAACRHDAAGVGGGAGQARQDGGGAVPAAGWGGAARRAAHPLLSR